MQECLGSNSCTALSYISGKRMCSVPTWRSGRGEVGRLLIRKREKEDSVRLARGPQPQTTGATLSTTGRGVVNFCHVLGEEEDPVVWVKGSQ